MANQQTDVLDGKLDDGRVMPMSLGNITGTAVESTRSVQTLLSRNGTLPFHAILDVPMTLVFEVGRTEINIKQLMELNKGSFVELRQVSVDTIDIRINDKLYAFGETIAMQQYYGIRFGELEIRAGVDDVDEDMEG